MTRQQLGFRIFLFAALVLIAWMSSGCASYANRDTQIAEFTWQSLHAVDTYQTAHITHASATCYREADPLAVKIYGTDEPGRSPQKIYAINAALGLAHYYVGRWIDRKAEDALTAETDTRGIWVVGRYVFYGASFIGTGYSVVNNAMRGCN